MILEDGSVNRPSTPGAPGPRADQAWAPDPSRSSLSGRIARPVTTVAPQSSSVWMEGERPASAIAAAISGPCRSLVSTSSTPPCARPRAGARPTRPGARSRKPVEAAVRARPAARGRAPRRAGTRPRRSARRARCRSGCRPGRAAPARQARRTGRRRRRALEHGFDVPPRARDRRPGRDRRRADSAQPASPLATPSPEAAPVPQHRSTTTGISPSPSGRQPASPTVRPIRGTRFAAVARTHRRPRRSAARELRPANHLLERFSGRPSPNQSVEFLPAPRRRQQQRRLVLGEDAPGAPQSGDHGRIVGNRIVAHGTPS